VVFVGEQAVVRLRHGFCRNLIESERGRCARGEKGDETA
jgi:hypothetical protein